MIPQAISLEKINLCNCAHLNNITDYAIIKLQVEVEIEMLWLHKAMYCAKKSYAIMCWFCCYCDKPKFIIQSEVLRCNFF